MGYYPVMLDVGQRSVALVGANREALMKIEGLRAAGAEIDVFDTHLDAPMASEIDDQVHFVPHLPHGNDLTGRALVIAAHHDVYVNNAIAGLARDVGVLVNVVDRPAMSDCIMVSQIRRGDLVIGVSTSAKAPGLAQRIRKALEPLFDDDWAKRLSVFHETREIIRAGDQGETRRALIKVEEERAIQAWQEAQRRG